MTARGTEGSGESPAPQQPPPACAGRRGLPRSLQAWGRLTASLETCLSVWQPSACPAHAREPSPVTHLLLVDQRPHSPPPLQLWRWGCGDARGRGRWWLRAAAGLPPPTALAPLKGGRPAASQGSLAPAQEAQGEPGVPAPQLPHNLGPQGTHQGPGRPASLTAFLSLQPSLRGAGRHPAAQRRCRKDTLQRVYSPFTSAA